MTLPQSTHEAIYKIQYSDDGSTMQIVLPQIKDLIDQLTKLLDEELINDNRFISWISESTFDSSICVFDISLNNALSTKDKEQAFIDAYNKILDFLNLNWSLF
jgi:hypothetical protein